MTTKPPSKREIILKALRELSECTLGDIQEETLLERRSVQDALKALVKDQSVVRLLDDGVTTYRITPKGKSKLGAEVKMPPLEVMLSAPPPSPFAEEEEETPDPKAPEPKATKPKAPKFLEHKPKAESEFFYTVIHADNLRSTKEEALKLIENLSFDPCEQKIVIVKCSLNGQIDFSPRIVNI